MEMIRLEHIVKIYSDNYKAVDDISLSVNTGEIVGVIGRSGAGKSTLLRCVNLLEVPTSGEVFVNGQSLLSLDENALREARRHIGMIFQHFNLLSSRTVYDNIALPLEFAGMSAQKIEQTILPLIELTGLTDKTHAYPNDLSGGQKQRVAIARALANDPKVLLCDEATSALDPETTDSILDLLNTINTKMGLTILMITHEMHVIKSICDRVALIDKGMIVEEGKTVDLFLNPQTALAQSFVSSALKRHLPPLWESRIQSRQSLSAQHCVWRILFRGEVTERPMINHLIEEFKLTINILQASIDTICDVTVGVMIVAVDGDEGMLHCAMQYLKEHTVYVEQIGYVN